MSEIYGNSKKLRLLSQVGFLSVANFGTGISRAGVFESSGQALPIEQWETEMRKYKWAIKFAKIIQ
jgi:hypothetical protein